MRGIIFILCAILSVSCSKISTLQYANILVEGQKSGFKLRYAVGNGDTTTVNSNDNSLIVKEIRVKQGDVIWAELVATTKQNSRLTILSENNETNDYGLAQPMTVIHSVK